MNSENFAYLPQKSIELEAAILGKILTSRDALRDGLILIRPGAQAFHHPRHQEIYTVIQQLNKTGFTPDYFTVMQGLASAGKVEQVGGSEYIRSLTQNVSYEASIEDYCKFLMYLWGKRQLAESLLKIAHTAALPTSNLQDLLAEGYTKISQVQEGLQTKGAVNLKDLIDSVVDQIELAAGTPGGTTGVPSGLESVDKVTGGWQPSDLIILAARPGVGKTSFALFQGVAASLAGYPGGIFNLEMNNFQMTRKTVATELGEYSTSQLQKGYFSGGLSEAQTIRGRLERLRGVDIQLDDTPGLSIGEFRGKAARMKAQHDIRWIVVDYLQLMTGEGKGSREQEIASISRGLKLTAKELNIPVIALSQLSRETEKRGGEKKPLLSDLRESGSIEQDADVVVFLYRPEYYGVKQDEVGNSVEDTTDVIFAKHRNGPLKEVTVGSTMNNGQYFDLDESGKPYTVPVAAPAAERFGPAIVGQTPLRTTTPSEFAYSDTGEEVGA